MISPSDDELRDVIDDIRAHADLGLNADASAPMISGVSRRLSAPDAAIPSSSHRPSWFRPQLLAVTAVAVAATAGTAMAVVSLSGTTSLPTSGLVETSSGPSGATGQTERQYDVAVTPDLSVGHVGWCASMSVRRRGTRAIGGGGGCVAAPKVGTQVFTAGLNVLGAKQQAYFALVGERVAGARFADGRVVLSRRDVNLPEGWRALVDFQPRDPKELPAMPEVAFLDQASRPIAENGLRANAYPALPVRRAAGKHQPSGPCQIQWTRKPATLRTVYSIGLASDVQDAPDLQGRPLLACGKTAVQLADSTYLVTALIDAKNPGETPPRLPGATPIAAGKAFAFPASAIARDATAMRDGAAWLVVQGGGQATRLALLRGARVQTRLPHSS